MKANTHARRLSITALAALAAWLFLPSSTVRADSLSTAAVGLFPKDAGEIAYADLSQARKFPWFAQFERQVLPPRFLEFAQFLKSAGVNPDSQVDGVAWALASKAANREGKDNSGVAAGDILCLAIGRFDPDAAQEFFEAHKIRAVEFLDHKIYASGAGGTGDLFMMFVDSSTIAFGPKGLLERLIRVQRGEEESLFQNELLLPLINQANGNGVFWSVLNSAGARQAIQQFVPVVANFGKSSDLIDKIAAVMITVKGSDRMDADILAVAGSPQDAVVLSQLLQAGLMLRQYQVSESNPDAAQILAGVTVAPSGAQLKISFSVTEDQLIALVKHNSFVTKM